MTPSQWYRRVRAAAKRFEEELRDLETADVADPALVAEMHRCLADLSKAADQAFAALSPVEQVR